MERSRRRCSRCIHPSPPSSHSYIRRHQLLLEEWRGATTATKYGSYSFFSCISHRLVLRVKQCGRFCTTLEKIRTVRHLSLSLAFSLSFCLWVSLSPLFISRALLLSIFTLAVVHKVQNFARRGESGRFVTAFVYTFVLERCHRQCRRNNRRSSEKKKDKENREIYADAFHVDKVPVDILLLPGSLVSPHMMILKHKIAIVIEIHDDRVPTKIKTLI